MASKKKSAVTIRPNKLNLPDHKLDIKKTLAERLEKQKREEELIFTPCSNDSLLALPILSDSMMECSQDTSQQLLDQKQNLHRLVTIEVFSGSMYTLFDETQVKFSWLDPNNVCQLEDVELTNPSMFILSKFKHQEMQIWSPKSNLISRYLLFLLSATLKRDLIDACTKILQEKISLKLFNISVPDFVAILMNYGAPLETLWQISGFNLTFNDPLRATNPSAPSLTSHKFPVQNMASLLSLFSLNLKISPYQFSTIEKIGLFNLFLNLLADKTIIKFRYILELMKRITTQLLDCFTDEEWHSRNSQLVEELVVTAFNYCNNFDTVGLVQRVGSIGDLSPRSAQVQQACAFFVIQECLGLSEIIAADDLLNVFGKAEKFPTNYEVGYCLVKAISYCIDPMDPATEKEKLLEVLRILNDWRHSIRDVSADCDTNRLAVKDLITELTWQLKDSFPIENVV